MAARLLIAVIHIGAAIVVKTALLVTAEAQVHVFLPDGTELSLVVDKLLLNEVFSPICTGAPSPHTDTEVLL